MQTSGKCIDHKGTEYPTFKAMCAAWSIDPSWARTQIKAGRLLEDVLEKHHQEKHHQQENIKNKHIGEIVTTRSGRKATLIAWRNWNDIDIKLDDGTILYGRAYANFKSGHIGNGTDKRTKESLRNQYLGERRLNSKGFLMTITEIRTMNDMSVRFDDGNEAKCSYYDFKRGYVQKPHLGETCISNAGQRVEIIKEHGGGKIDVQFEDGVIVTNRTYTEFTHKGIKNPGLIGRSRIGETRKIHGHNCTLIAWRASNDIDVQFDDGFIAQHKTYYAFQHGKISLPGISKERPGSRIDTKGYLENKYLHKSYTKNDGQQYRIIKIEDSKHVQVCFDDGTEVTTNLSQASKGQAKNPNHPSKKPPKNPELYVGQTRIARNGQKMTIVEYRKNNDIDVVFDDGTIVMHKRFGNFTRGNIKNPNKPALTENEWCRKKYEGMSVIQTNGQNAVLEAYHTNRNCDIRFEDGTLVLNQNLIQFRNGRIINPNKTVTFKISQNEFILEYYLSSFGFIKYDSGRLAKIDPAFGRMELDLFNEKSKVAIEYDGNVHLRKGSIERDKRKTALCIKNGIVLIRIREPLAPELRDGSYELRLQTSHPMAEDYENVLSDQLCPLLTQLTKRNIDPDIDFARDAEDIGDSYIHKYRTDRVGATAVNKQGLKMEVIAVRTFKDIDVRFEDGFVIKHTKFEQFNKCSLMDPNIKRYSSIPEKYAEQNEGMISHHWKTGELMTCIAYRNSNDIDVQLEDGTILQHKYMHDFITGHIGPCDNQYYKIESTDHLGNKYDSITDMCKRYNISICTYKSRIKNGWSLERALTTPRLVTKHFASKKCLDHLGNEYASEKEMCEHYGIPAKTFRARIKNGWRLHDALLKSPHDYHVTDEEGNVYESIKAMCCANHVSVDAVRKFTKSGMPLSEALKEAKNRAEKVIIRDHVGNIYPNIRDMLSQYGITKSVYYRRLKDGWTLQMALTTPLNATRGRASKKSIVLQNGKTYESIKAFCEDNNISISKYEYYRVHGIAPDDMIKMCPLKQPA